MLSDTVLFKNDRKNGFGCNNYLNNNSGANDSQICRHLGLRMMLPAHTPQV